jgi:hypothetical protein
MRQERQAATHATWDFIVTSPDRTPLRPVDTEAAKDYWRSFKRTQGRCGQVRDVEQLVSTVA